MSPTGWKHSSTPANDHTTNSSPNEALYADFCATFDPKAAADALARQASDLLPLLRALDEAQAVRPEVLKQVVSI